MTIEEAIKTLTDATNYTYMMKIYYSDPEFKEAYNMAIDALKYQQSYYDQLVDYKQVAENIG